MSLHYNDPILNQSEAVAQGGDVAEALRSLRGMPLGDFLALPVSLDRQRFPALAKMTATMPAPDVQARWTGHSGQPLLAKSCGTLRLLQLQSFLLRGRDLGAGPILDYGCGWGRLTRGLGYFVDPEQIHGADPMEDSLALCRKHRVVANLHKVATVPSANPVPANGFDMVFSYSVMTHTSMASTLAILAAIRSIIAEDGIYATTIRPVEFWAGFAAKHAEGFKDDLIRQHHANGYAFLNSGDRKELEAENYGDVSFSLEKFGEMAAQTGWRIARLDRDTLEPRQLTVSLMPA